MNKKIRLNIGGMTCINCQNKIENALNGTGGILTARVSYNNSSADIEYDDAVLSRDGIAAVIEKLDYKVLSSPKNAAPNLTNIISILVIIVSLYVLLQQLGVLNLLVPSTLADSSMGYGTLFVIGLITSVHCIAMCGGINISQCIPREARSKSSALLPSLAYNAGRVLSYTAVGFVLGLVGYLIGGSEIGISTLLQGVLKIVAGLFMVIMGVNMLGLFPWLRKFTIRMPRVFTKKARSTRPFVVGILNGFMPCGPLQSMWIVALAAANPFSGALSMLLFSLGTVPLMLGLGSAVSALGRKFTDKVMTVGAVLVTVLGLAMLSQGGLLSGWLPPDLLLVIVIALCVVGVLLSIPTDKKALKNVMRAASVAVAAGAVVFWSFRGNIFSQKSDEDSYTMLVDGVQVVNSTLSSGRYPNITVRAGTPVKWVINAPEGSINGCNNRFIIRDYGIEYTFHSGENTIEFTPDEVGTIQYSCWMGMIRGSIVVTGGQNV